MKNLNQLDEFKAGDTSLHPLSDRIASGGQIALGKFLRVFFLGASFFLTPELDPCPPIRGEGRAGWSQPAASGPAQSDVSHPGELGSLSKCIQVIPQPKTKEEHRLHRSQKGFEGLMYRCGAGGGGGVGIRSGWRLLKEKRGSGYSSSETRLTNGKLKYPDIQLLLVVLTGDSDDDDDALKCLQLNMDPMSLLFGDVQGFRALPVSDDKC